NVVRKCGRSEPENGSFPGGNKAESWRCGFATPAAGRQGCRMPDAACTRGWHAYIALRRAPNHRRREPQNEPIVIFLPKEITESERSGHVSRCAPGSGVMPTDQS